MLDPKAPRTLEPKTRLLRDYKRCFYGCKFEEEPELRLKLKEFLGKKGMEIHPAVRPGVPSWPEAAAAMRKSAFCVFETATRSPSIHLELGYAIAQQLNVIVLQDKEKPEAMPTSLGGLLKVPYDRKNLNMLVTNLENPKILPKDWYAVEDRLLPLLRGATAADRRILEMLAQGAEAGGYFTVADVASGARQSLAEASPGTLADFLRRFDELIEYKDGSAPAAFGAQQVRLDNDYRAYVAGELNL